MVASSLARGIAVRLEGRCIDPRVRVARASRAIYIRRVPKSHCTDCRALGDSAQLPAKYASPEAHWQLAQWGPPAPQARVKGKSGQRGLRVPSPLS